MSQRQPSVATPLSFADHLTVFAWRRMLMPLLEVIGGSSAPRGRVVAQRYGALPDETVDVIAPPAASPGRAPVVFIHGGGWIAGSKGRFYNRPLLRLADAGHLVFSLNYPRAPERPHPLMLRSLLAGLAWLKQEHAAREVHLIGDSAGGNLATMLGLMIANPELLPRFDTIDPSTLPAVRSITSLYGVMDRFTLVEDGFPSARLFLRSYAGPSALDPQPATIPITPMDLDHFAVLPRTFVVGAGNDKLARSSKVWAERLQQRFTQVQYKVYEGAEHGFFCFGKGSVELSGDLLRFLDASAGT
jgi:acetyl esterase/lipase